MKYENLEKFILGVLFVYFVFGSVWKFLPAGHLYPFFSWDLYSTIPNSFSVYDIKFTSVGDKKFDPPESYKEVFPGQADDLFLLAEDLSISVKNGNASRIAVSQQELRKMVGDSVSYVLVECVYDPLDYKNGKPPLEIKNLGHFELQ